MRFLFVPAFLSLLIGVAHAKVQAHDVLYRDGNQVLQGYVARDDSFKGKRPVIVIFHQWKGLTDYEKGRARMLAQMGYVAFAADVYGKGIRPTSKAEAGQQAGKYKSNIPLMRSRAKAALMTAEKQPFADAKKVAATGYCFGGGVALELARSGAPLKGTATFHGSLDTPHPEDAKNIKGKVLVMHGADDPIVNPKIVADFWKEMNDAKVNLQFEAYGNAVHSFTEKDAGNNPASGAAYNASADKRSWATFTAFLREIFR